MHDFLLYDASRKYDDGYGGEVYIGEQLDYVSNESGTPDCYTSVDTFEEALKIAKSENFPVIIAGDFPYRVLAVIIN